MCEKTTMHYDYDVGLKSTTISPVFVVLRSRGLGVHPVTKSLIRFLYSSSCPLLVQPTMAVVRKRLYMSELWSVLKVGSVQGEQSWREHGSLRYSQHHCLCASGGEIGGARRWGKATGLKSVQLIRTLLLWDWDDGRCIPNLGNPLLAHTQVEYALQEVSQFLLLCLVVSSRSPWSMDDIGGWNRHLLTSHLALS